MKLKGALAVSISALLAVAAGAHDHKGWGGGKKGGKYGGKYDGKKDGKYGDDHQHHEKDYYDHDVKDEKDGRTRWCPPGPHHPDHPPPPCRPPHCSNPLEQCAQRTGPGCDYTCTAWEEIKAKWDKEENEDHDHENGYVDHAARMAWENCKESLEDVDCGEHNHGDRVRRLHDHDKRDKTRAMVMCAKKHWDDVPDACKESVEKWYKAMSAHRPSKETREQFRRDFAEVVQYVRKVCHEPLAAVDCFHGDHGGRFRRLAHRRRWLHEHRDRDGHHHDDHHDDHDHDHHHDHHHDDREVHMHIAECAKEHWDDLPEECQAGITKMHTYLKKQEMMHHEHHDHETPDHQGSPLHDRDGHADPKVSDCHGKKSRTKRIVYIGALGASALVAVGFIVLVFRRRCKRTRRQSSSSLKHPLLDLCSSSRSANDDAGKAVAHVMPVGVIVGKEVQFVQREANPADAKIVLA